MAYGGTGQGRFKSKLVVCPCGPKCRGYTNDPEEPNRCHFAYETKTYPRQFIKGDPDFINKFKMGVARLMGAVYVVYECPRCRCEVLLFYQEKKSSNIFEDALTRTPELEWVKDRSRC